MHPDDGELQALIDGELDERGSRDVLEHLETCEACRARKESLEVELERTAGLLRTLDREAPEIAVEAVVEEAERRTLPRTTGGHRTLLAASLAGLLVAGAVVAAIVPGSPLLEVVERIVRGSEAERPPGPAVPDPGGQDAGVAWVPSGGLEVVFEAGQTEGSIELIRTGGDTARVEVRSDSVGFVVGHGSVLVQNRDSRASYRVAVPLDLPNVRIRVGPRTVYEMTGGRVLLDEFQKEGGVRKIPLSENP
ncbi:MAG: anti-sigma factor family protein [Gemmatimonadota bacterium]